MITNFPDKPSYNSGGLKTFSFLPVVGVASNAIVLANAAIEPVVFVAGYAFLKGYATINSLQFNDEPTENEHGIFHEQSLNGFTPGDSRELSNLFVEMLRMKFLVVAKDYLGNNKLIGTKENPLSFSYKFSTGNDRKDSRGFKFAFSGVGTQTAVNYPF